jgi:phage/plasmid-like protein (TIGR03299 family)
MPDEIEKMMYVGDVPWHGLGQGLPKEVTAVESLPQAGLDWPVETRPLFVGEQEVKSHKAVVRVTDNSVLGVVGRMYKPIQNRSVAELADAIANQGALCHTAGSLENGRKIWFLLLVPGELRIGADESEIKKYLLLTNSHDGSYASRVFVTPVRVVCANTLNFALERGLGEGISIRHTVNAEERMREAQKALQGVIGFYDRFEKLSQRLALDSYSDDLMKELSEELFPQSEKKEKLHSFTQRNRDKLTELFHVGTGLHAVRGTAWAALNAVSEFSDHWKTSKSSKKNNASEIRARSVWFGDAFLLKTKALRIILRQLGLCGFVKKLLP